MKNLFIFFVTCFLLSTLLQAQESEFKDTPFLSAMPDYDIWDVVDIEFDAYQFCDGKKLVEIEGKFWRREYGLKNDGKEASGLQIIRNYSNAIKNMGGVILIEGEREKVEQVCRNEERYARQVSGKVTKGDSELWIEVGYHEYNGTYIIIIVEKQLMKQGVTANALLDSLNVKGYVTLYINFNTGKSTIKDESKPIIDQIVEMMNLNKEIEISVEGHTDNVGSPQSNLTLSQERAKSVVAAIVAQGIDQKRLSSLGHGEDKPIADNNTEEGRTQNRRVELIKK